MRYYCVKQHDISDCGAACIATISKQYGLLVSIAKIRQIAGTDKNGTNVYGMVKVAEQLGFTAKAVKGNQEALFSNFPLPAIAHIVSEDGLLHYIVIHKIEKGKILIADPAKGLIKITAEEFINMWSGIFIILVPSETFIKGKTSKNLFERFWVLLLPQKKLLMDIFLASLLVTIFGILGAFYFQVVIDEILGANLKDTLNVLSIGVLILSIFSVLLSALRSQLLLYMSQKLDIALLLGYYEHVLRLPMNFFETRKIGEIVSRFQDATSIREIISDATLTVMLDTIMAIIGGIMLYLKSKFLFAITVVMLILYSLLVFVFNKPYRKANEKQLEDNAQMTSYLVESLNGIQTVKAFNGENVVRIETEFKFIILLKSIFHLGSMANIQGMLTALVEAVGGVVLVWIGAYNVISGRMTIGSLITFNAILVYFLEPIKNLIGLQSAIQTAIVASDRLGEILDLEIEKDESENSRINLISLKGDISIKGVTFRYGARMPVLKKLNMEIKAGEHIAIVGESGAGKSTLAKILLRLYTYESGIITIGGVALPDIMKECLREKIAYVPQETFLFSGTIMENLVFGIDNPDMEEVIRCAKFSKVQDFVNELPLRYDTYLSENGSNLSGGQRQRLSIARAILKHPDILILDESTSNLDAATERTIQDTLFEYSKDMTTIIIAHRLSTIRACDRIFVMKNGSIVESGTHDDLMELKDGYYKELYLAQTGV